MREQIAMSSRVLFCVVALVGGQACGGQAESAEAKGDVEPVTLSQQSNGPDPNGTYFANVDANGTGCPLGTWHTSISRDGLVFTTTFSGYEAQVNPSTGMSVKDCQLSIRLHTPAGTSFSVQKFSYSGYALLDEGVTGRQLASYYFQGQSVQSQAARTDLVGPYDQNYVFHDEVPIRDAVWSPCGVERELNITTRIVVQNSTPGRSGYMNLTAADGTALQISLASRNCSDFGTSTNSNNNSNNSNNSNNNNNNNQNQQPSGGSLTIGESDVLDIDDFGNANLLLAQATTLSRSATLQSLSFYVSKAAGRLRLGIYDATGPNGGPGAKRAETGELRPVLGWNTARVSPVKLPAGTYWLTYITDTDDLHFQRGGEQSGRNTWYTYPYGPMPARFSTSPIVSTDHWSFYGSLTY